jgi:hypothetical protein
VLGGCFLIASGPGFLKSLRRETLVLKIFIFILFLLFLNFRENFQNQRTLVLVLSRKLKELAGFMK